MIRLLRLLGFVVLAMAAQWLWATHFSLAGFSPQLLLVLTILAATRHGPVAAMGLGFLWGLFLDISAARLFGANALALTLVGYGAGAFRRQVDVAGLAPQGLIVFIMTWAYFLIIGFLGLFFARGFAWVGWPQFLLGPFYNCVVAVFIAAFWNSWSRR